LPLFQNHLLLFIFTMNPDFIMKSNAPSFSNERRLIDYTKEKNPNIVCNRGIAHEISSKTISLSRTNEIKLKPCYENTVAHSYQPSLTSKRPTIGKIENSSSTDMDEVVNFFLKIPPIQRRRARSLGSPDISRKEYFLSMLNEQPSRQRSISDQVIKSAIQKSKRRLSLVSNVLRRESNNVNQPF